MKATGIIRRVDELGRIVIPKEIRRAVRVKEGDPLEIFLERGEIVLKKYDETMNYIDDINAIIADVESTYCYDDKRRTEICDILNKAINIIKENSESA